MGGSFLGKGLKFAACPWTSHGHTRRTYSYTDTVFLPDDLHRTYPGGISFTHDQGVGNVFAPAGQSAYEQGGLHGLFSHMTHEQLVNWVVCACAYVVCPSGGTLLL